MDLNTPQWQHDPTRTEADASDTERELMAELGLTWADLHQGMPLTGVPGQRSCMGCWCYGCGARTDQPRIRHAENDPRPEDDDHRWCFE